MRYDMEMLLDDIETLLKAKLNLKLQAIAAEKAALGLVEVDTPDIADDGYFQQSWSDRILNQSPAIFYGVESVTATGMGPATVEALKLFVEVVLVDPGLDTLGTRRVNRYARALKEVFQENFDRLPWSNKTIVETIRPTAFTLDLNSSEEVKVGGVSIATAIA